MSASASETASTTMPPARSEQLPAASSSSSAHEGKEKKKEHNFNEQTFYVPRKQIIAIFLTLGLIDFIALMDQTTLAASLPIIGDKLHAGSQTSLISSAYFITSTAFQLLYGRISDIVGRKPLLLALLALFFVGSLGSSLSETYVTLILFRAIVGIAGGGIMTVAQIIVSDVVSLRERGKYQGILGALVAVANGIGPVVGGALTTRTENTGGWRNIFRLSLPTSAAGIIGVLIFMPLKKVDGDWRVKARAIDYLGALLSLVASTLIVLGFTWAGGRYEWTSIQVLAPLFVGLATAVLFCLWQYKGDKPSRPALMPLYMFTNATVCGACITQFINGWLFVSQVYMIPQFYQAVYGYDATKAGLMLIPLTVSQTITSTVSGLLITWTGRYRELLLLGWTLWPTGLGLVSTLNQHSGMPKQIGYSLLTGVGVGLTLQPSLIAIQGAVPRKTMAVVTATRNFVRNLGGAIGLALCGTVVSLYLRSEPDDPLRANQRGFRTVFIVLASLGAAGLVAAVLLLKHSSVERHDDELLRQQAKHELQQTKYGKGSSAEATQQGYRCDTS